MQLQSLPPPHPFPHPPPKPFPLQQVKRSKIIIIQLHPPSFPHPHPVLQFVAAKSLIVEPPKVFLHCYSMWQGLTAFQFFEIFLRLFQQTGIYCIEIMCYHPHLMNFDIVPLHLSWNIIR